MDMVPLPPDFKDFLQLLNRYEVEYLLIGGYAVAYHGYVRYTGDMDIFVRLSPENAARLRNVLIDFGFPEQEVRSIVSGIRSNHPDGCASYAT